MKAAHSWRSHATLPQTCFNGAAHGDRQIGRGSRTTLSRGPRVHASMGLPMVIGRGSAALWDLYDATGVLYLGGAAHGFASSPASIDPTRAD